MKKIKLFLLDDSATAETTVKVIIIASVAFVLAVEIIVWYDVLKGFFIVGGILEKYGSNFKL